MCVYLISLSPSNFLNPAPDTGLPVWHQVPQEQHHVGTLHINNHLHRAWWPVPRHAQGVSVFVHVFVCVFGGVRTSVHASEFITRSWYCKDSHQIRCLSVCKRAHFWARIRSLFCFCFSCLLHLLWFQQDLIALLHNWPLCVEFLLEVLPKIWPGCFVFRNML